MFRNLGPIEFGIIAMVVIMLFGASRLPKLAKAIGESIRELRSAGKAIEDEKKVVEASLRDAGKTIED